MLDLKLYITNRGVYNTSAVGTEGIRNVSDIDCVQVFVVAGMFYKDLWKEMYGFYLIILRKSG